MPPVPDLISGTHAHGVAWWSYPLNASGGQASSAQNTYIRASYLVTTCNRQQQRELDTVQSGRMMSATMRNLATILFIGSVALSGCSKKEEPKEAPPAPEKPAPAPVTVDKGLLASFGALPEVMAAEGRELTDEKINLGRMLYFDKRLSKNQDISCNSCHMLDKFGVDNEPTSKGHKEQRGSRNSPTVYNAAAHVAQFWDGRAKDVEEQAKGPVLNPVEMAMPSDKAVVKVLKSIPGYADAFKAAFPNDKDPITYDNMAVAIGAFERKLVTPSKWDAFLAGDESALTDAEKKGFGEFATAGCPTCHSGAFVGGHMFQKLGLVKPWPNDKDQGRFEVTKNDADKMMFKVPSLRNVTKTAPYFHDGSVADLGEAVKMMAEYQLGKELSKEQIDSIVAFLGSLTGELPTDYIAEPTLPESGPKTPKPDPT